MTKEMRDHMEQVGTCILCHRNIPSGAFAVVHQKDFHSQVMGGYWRSGQTYHSPQDHLLFENYFHAGAQLIQPLVLSSPTTFIRVGFLNNPREIEKMVYMTAMENHGTKLNKRKQWLKYVIKDSIKATKIRR